MNIHDLLDKNKQVNEAPLGLLQRTGLGLKKAFGNQKAAGQLDTGKDANALHDEYMNFIGRTGEEPSAENLLDFLTSKGYPTAKASQVLGVQPSNPVSPEAKAAAQTRKDKQAVAAKAAQDQMAANPAPAKAEPAPQTPAEIRAAKQAAAAKRAQDELAASPELPKKEKPAAPAATAAPATAPAAKPKGEPDAMGRIEPTMDQPPAEKPSYGGNAYGNQTVSVNGKPAATGAVPSTANPLAGVQKPAPAEPAPKAKTHTGGKVAGQVSQTPGAIRKRQARAAAGTVKKLGTPTAESLEFDGLIISEALSDKQIDAALMAAAQERAKAGATAQKAAPAVEPAAQAPAEPTAADKLGAGIAKNLLTPDSIKRAQAFTNRPTGGGNYPFGDEEAANPLEGIDTAALKKALATVLSGKPLADKEAAVVRQLYDKL